MRTLLTLLAWGLLALPLCAQEEFDESDDSPVPGWRHEFMRRYEKFLDYGYDWRLGSDFSVNSEDGLILGAGPILYGFGFRTFPYVYRMELLGSVSIPTARFKLAYTALWPRLSQRLSLDLRSHASQLELRNFYGFGNASLRDEVKEEEAFYRVASTELYVQPSLRYRVAEWVFLGLTALVKDTKVRESDEARFLNESNLAEFGDNRTLGALGFSVLIDSRDHPVTPHSGFTFAGEAWNFLEVFGNQTPFQKYTGDLRLYVGDTIGTDIMLAVRLHGEIVRGVFPFHEAAFLGGFSSVRGYPSQRFAGDAALFGSAEIRVSLGKMFLVVPTEVGLVALVDGGRVWVEGASPGGLHTDAGGGLWLAPINRDLLVSLAVASSVEGLFVSGGIGFAF